MRLEDEVPAEPDSAPTVPWDSTPSPGWIDAVDGWPWREIGDGACEKTGSCPRCGHAMDTSAGGLVDQIAPQDAQIAAEDAPRLRMARTFYVRCNCGETHPGRPAALERGCGQAGMIEPPLQA